MKRIHEISPVTQKRSKKKLKNVIRELNYGYDPSMKSTPRTGRKSDMSVSNVAGKIVSMQKRKRLEKTVVVGELKGLEEDGGDVTPNRVSQIGSVSEARSSSRHS